MQAGLAFRAVLAARASLFNLPKISLMAHFPGERAGTKSSPCAVQLGVHPGVVHDVLSEAQLDVLPEALHDIHAAPPSRG